MATAKAKTEKNPGELQTVRVPLYTDAYFRPPRATSSDSRVVNAFLEKLETANTGSVMYTVIKRPALAAYTRPTGGDATGRGIYSWKGNMYSVFGSSIYKDTTLLISNMGTSTGICYFTETNPSAPTEYLAVNDGSWLYLIDTSGGVTILNNVVISTSSVAASTTITTATNHGLATGNKIIIRNHAGSTPSLNDTVYTVTVTGATTFTIPVTVTVGGTGGTIGVFPVNTRHIESLNGYMVVGTSIGRVYNCEYNNPLSWPTASYITAQMKNDSLIGISSQNNYIVVLKEKSIQFLYDNSNSPGSPFTNAEQAINQVGCSFADSIQSAEDAILWVGASNTGGFSVFRLQGISNLKDIGRPPINRRLDIEFGQSIICNYFRVTGNEFYSMYCPTDERTFVWCEKSDTWTTWTGTSISTRWPIMSTAHQNTGGTGSALFGQDPSSGNIYNISMYVYQDNGTNFTVRLVLGNIDFDTNRRKWWESVELIADTATFDSSATLATCPVEIAYSDDDGNSHSTVRTLNISNQRAFSRSWGTGRRRTWRVDVTSATTFRAFALEFQIRIGEY